MSFTRTADRIYALRFLRLLTTPWKKTGAYKAGIIDSKGKMVKKPKSGKEKDVYNLFHKLVFNLKKLLNKIPFGKSTLASYAAALWLIKEETGLSEKLLGECLYEITGYNPCDNIDSTDINEQVLSETITLKDGSEILQSSNPINQMSENTTIGTIFGFEIVESIHPDLNQKVLVCGGYQNQNKKPMYFS